MRDKFISALSGAMEDCRLINRGEYVSRTVVSNNAIIRRSLHECTVQ